MKTLNDQIYRIQTFILVRQKLEERLGLQLGETFEFKSTKRCTIMNVFENSIAHSLGIQTGWLINKIQGQSVVGYNLAAIYAILKTALKIEMEFYAPLEQHEMDLLDMISSKNGVHGKSFGIRSEDAAVRNTVPSVAERTPTVPVQHTEKNNRLYHTQLTESSKRLHHNIAEGRNRPNHNITGGSNRLNHTQYTEMSNRPNHAQFTETSKRLNHTQFTAGSHCLNHTSTAGSNLPNYTATTGVNRPNYIATAGSNRLSNTATTGVNRLNHTATTGVNCLSNTATTGVNRLNHTATAGSNRPNYTATSKNCNLNNRQSTGNDIVVNRKKDSTTSKESRPEMTSSIVGTSDRGQERDGLTGMDRVGNAVNMYTTAVMNGASSVEALPRRIEEFSVANHNTLNMLTKKHRFYKSQSVDSIIHCGNNVDKCVAYIEEKRFLAELNKAQMVSETVCKDQAQHKEKKLVEDIKSAQGFFQFFKESVLITHPCERDVMDWRRGVNFASPDSKIRKIMTELLQLENKAYRWYKVPAKKYAEQVACNIIESVKLHGTRCYCSPDNCPIVKLLQGHVDTYKRHLFSMPDNQGGVPKAFIKADNNLQYDISQDGFEILE